MYWWTWEKIWGLNFCQLAGLFFEHTWKKSINLQKQISSCQKIHPQKLSQIIKNHQKIGNPVSVKRNLAQSIQNHRQGQANLVKIQHFIIIYPKFYRISSGFDDFKSENTEFIHSILAFLTNIKSVWAQLQESRFTRKSGPYNLWDYANSTSLAQIQYKYSIHTV